RPRRHGNARSEGDQARAPGVGRREGRPGRALPRPHPTYGGSRLGVGADLVADDLLADPAADVVLQAVGEGDHHVGDPAVLDELGQEGAPLAALVVAQELTRHLERQVALEVEDEVVEQVGDEPVHRPSTYRTPPFLAMEKGW